MQAVEKPTYEKSILSTARGGSILAAGRLFEFGSRFVIAIFLARLLGAEQYGLYNLAITTTLLVAGIATLGLDTALVRYVAMLRSKGDEAGVWGAVQIGIGLSLSVSVFVGLGLFLSADLIAEQLFHEPALAPLLKLLSLLVPFLTLTHVLVGAAHGYKKMEYSAISLNFVQMVVRMVLIVILSFIGLNAFRATLAFAISDLAAAATLVVFLNRDIHWKRPLSTGRRDYREILSFSLPLWMSDVLKKFRKNIQTILLGAMSTVANVGIFALISKINLIGRVTYHSIVASVKPVFAELYAQKDWNQMGGVYQTTTRWTFTLNLPIFLVMVLFPGAILSIFGASYVGGTAALVLLACAELANAGTGVCGSIIDMTGRTKLKLVNSVVWITLSIGGNLLLIPRWGVLGAATATLVSTAIINLVRVTEVWVLYRLIPYNLSFVKPLIAGLSALAAGVVVRNWVVVDSNIVYLLIGGIMICAVYGGLLLLMGLAPEDHAVLARMKRRLGLMFSRYRTPVRRDLPVQSE